MFKLDFHPTTFSKRIKLSDKIYLTGSCFSEEIGKKCVENKLDTISNPFGTIFNPISIFKTLRGKFEISNIIESQEVIFHWDMHGTISEMSYERLKEKIESKTIISNEYLGLANWLIITPGTSFVYEKNGTNEIVANCHKVPASEFNKRLLTTKEIIDDFKLTYQHLKNNNPNIQIIFTVSPVRHIRDGLVENNRSKAILLSAIHEIIDMHKDVYYFPSYEIIIDELRDYRFFSKDMVHPNELAVNYVWNVFSDTYFNKDLLLFLKEWQSAKNSLNHKPLFPNTNQHQIFLKKTLTKLEELNKTADMRKEIRQIKSQLN